MLQNILKKRSHTREDIIKMLFAKPEEASDLFDFARKIRREHIGKNVYLRGLIELSNICSKDCFYCGIRKSNKNVNRYSVDEKSIIEAAEFAYKNNFGSVVIQSGELASTEFIERIDNTLKLIKRVSHNKLGITLSVGEQTEETYQKWFKSGAHRFLLRIESSNQDLFEQIHPYDSKHSFKNRLESIRLLQKIGYQTGTGVMIGLPNQSIEDLADDILFFKKMNIDMIGMGPYVEHENTPLFKESKTLLPIKERFFLSLKMIAVLRIIMKNINIAAATALQAIDPLGREKALDIGANVLMPNITPNKYRTEYQLYRNKPNLDDNIKESMPALEESIENFGLKIAYSEWGDSKFYFERNRKNNSKNC